MSDTSDLLEEILSHISLILSETRNYLAGQMNAEEFNKVKFISDQIHEIESLFNTYTKVDEKTIDTLKRIVIKPLSIIKQDTPVIKLEKILLLMTKSIMNQMGNEVNIDDTNEDDLIEVQYDLFMIFRSYPTKDYQLLKDISTGDARISQLKKLRRDFEAKVIPKYEASDKSIRFDDFVEEELKIYFNELWNTTFEDHAKEDLIQQGNENRYKLRNLKERILKKFLESKVTSL